MKKLLALATGALSFAALPSLALAQGPASETVYNPEEYTGQGQTNGCGVSFVTVWSGDGGEIIGVSASVNFFFVPEKKNVIALIKASAIMNGVVTPLSYAWLEGANYGRSTDFTKGPVEDPNAFVAVKNSDPKTVTLVIDVAHSGSTLGVALKGRPIDDIVKLPAPPEDVITKVTACFSSLTSRMQATLR